MSELNADLAVKTVRDGFRDVHQRMRELIAGLDAEALNWKPHPDANSLTVLVTHTLGAEREMLAAVRGVKLPRDRPSEFVARGDAAGLGLLLDDADAWLLEQTGAMVADDLVSDRRRGDRPPQPGIHWLVTIYGHSREHLAQMELTKQLYSAG